MIDPKDKNTLGVETLYEVARNEWIDLAPYQSNFIQFPSNDLTLEKVNDATPAATVNRYPSAQCRVNSDGLVLMKGLLRTAGNTVIGGGTVVFVFPRWLMPRQPQELRWNGMTSILRLDPQTRELKVDGVLVSTTWVGLGNIMYYLD